jgi:hypothetical protein
MMISFHTYEGAIAPNYQTERNLEGARVVETLHNAMF